MWRPILLLLLLVASLPAGAQSANVVLGRTDCFVLRDRGSDASLAARVNRIQTVFARHLGRSPGQLTLRTDGARRLIYLDGDLLVEVTPADALATHHESAATLAPVWRDRLQRAWEENSPTGAVRRSEARTQSPEPARGDPYVPFLAGILLAVLGLVAVVVRMQKQTALLVTESHEWQRETSEALIQAVRTPPALPAPEMTSLTPAIEGEVARVAKEQSRVVVNEAVQQICDSVERVMSNLLEEMARGVSRVPAPEVIRESVLAGAGRAALLSEEPPANGGDLPHEPPPLPRRGPTTLEITAFGKTYAFPITSDRAKTLIEAWSNGGTVPETWFHESGVTTARLQPLLDRFILRRENGADGSVAYGFDSRGSTASFEVRNLT